MGTLKTQSNGPLYSNTVIGTVDVDGWAVILAQRGGACNSPPVNGHVMKLVHTNFILLRGRSRQRERLNALGLSICLFVCLSVAKMQKRDFLKN